MVEMKAIDQERMAERALGQIEGAAFCQSDLLRDIMMGAVEDIDEAMKQQRARIKELEESVEGHTGLLEYVLKQKDELLTENARLREQVEGLKTTTQSADADSSTCAGEPDTSPALCATSPQGEGGERIATSGLEAPPRNDSKEESQNVEKGCEYCRGERTLCHWEGIQEIIDGCELVTTGDGWSYRMGICFCPVCGRSL